MAGNSPPAEDDRPSGKIVTRLHIKGSGDDSAADTPPPDTSARPNTAERSDAERGESEPVQDQPQRPTRPRRAAPAQPTPAGPRRPTTSTVTSAGATPQTAGAPASPDTAPAVQGTDEAEAEPNPAPEPEQDIAASHTEDGAGDEPEVEDDTKRSASCDERDDSGTPDEQVPPDSETGDSDPDLDDPALDDSDGKPDLDVDDGDSTGLTQNGAADGETVTEDNLTAGQPDTDPNREGASQISSEAGPDPHHELGPELDGGLAPGAALTSGSDVGQAAGAATAGAGAADTSATAASTAATTSEAASAASGAASTAAAGADAAGAAAPGGGTARRAVNAAKAAKDGEMMDAADEGTKVALEVGINAAAPGAGTATVEILERVPGGRKVTRAASYGLIAALAAPFIAITLVIIMLASVVGGIFSSIPSIVAAACNPPTNNPVGNPTLDDPGAEETARYIWNQLTQNGFTKEAAAGVLGNVQAESTFNPTIWNNGCKECGSGAYGLFQWGTGGDIPDRWNPLATWAKSSGYDPDTVKGQLAMMLQEITVGGADTVYVGSRDKANQAKSPEEGARLWHEHYEKAPGQATAERQQFARQWYDKYVNANTTAPGTLFANTTYTIIAVAVPAAVKAFPAEASPAAKPGRTWPLPPDTPVASGYKTAERPDHDGTDFGYPAGLPIYAATDGVVKNLTDTNPGGYGYYVEINSPDGVMTQYGHLNANNIVPDGTTVKAGDVIGTSGDTYGTGGGIAHDNAPHLHFRVHVNGQSIDPIAWLNGAEAPKGGTPASGSAQNCGSPGGPPPSGGVNYSGSFVPGGLQLPVAEINSVSSRFGPRNFGGRGWENHRGMDFPGGSGGQPIRAVDGGIVTVLSIAESGGYGNLVFVDHGGGWKTSYAHMADVYVRTGQEVKGGDVVGTVGTTGDSTGPHLHFEIFKDGVQIDPAPFFTGLVYQPGA